MDTNDELPTPERESPPGGLPLGAVFKGIVLGALAVVPVGLLLYVLLVIIPNRLPVLTATEYSQAMQRWKERKPKSYELDIEVAGWEPGQIHVEVRNGEVTAMTRNGIAPKSRQLWDYWTVDYLLEFIGGDLALQKSPELMAEKFKIPPETPITVRGKFDPDFGYPARYRRSIAGTRMDLEWMITRFSPTGDKSGDAPAQ